MAEGEDTDSDVNALLLQLRSARNETTSSLELAAADERRRQTRDRSLLARVVILTFAISIIVVALGYLLAVIVIPVAEQEAWFGFFDSLTEFLTQFLLPVVTLVLGFYFGRGRDPGQSDE
jgi:ABC-type Fe3+ transport system permease subunit